ncbi:hypothetical protein Tco_0901743 [Tanacetum coccineum]
MTTYTAYLDPKGVIYKNQNNRNRLMHADKLHKFSDGTLNDVWTALHDIAKGIRMEYLPKRKWSGLDKQRAQVMVQDIDKQLYERSQNRRDLHRDIPLDSVEVLSFEVSVSTEGVEELKRKVKLKGEKKEALITLRQKPGQYICCQESQR